MLGCRTAIKTLRWIRSRYNPGAVILGYHRIAKEINNPQHLLVSPKNFKEQLAVLARYNAVISLPQLAENLRNNTLNKRSIAITFDDGYRDTLLNAKPLLDQQGLPSTVFIATGFIGREFWWDALERIIYSSSQLPTMINLLVSRRAFSWNSSRMWLTDKRRELLNQLCDFFAALPYMDQQLGLHQLQQLIPQSRTSVAKCSAMTEDEIVHLGQDEKISLGSHSVNHSPFAQLKTSEQHREISQSVQCLESLTGHKVIAFSYPNGSFTKHSTTIAKNNGIRIACNSLEDVVTATCSPYELPRFWVPNWNGKQFSRWLKWWLQ